MITSTANEKIKHAAALQQKARLRREESLFVIEGGRLFWEAPASLIQEVYVSERFLENVDGKMKERLAETGYETVSEQVFAKMSDTKAPQGILAVLAQQKCEKEALLGKSPLLLLLENIQDPGNLGTILRTAEGAGVTGVIMSCGCLSAQSSAFHDGKPFPCTFLSGGRFLPGNKIPAGKECKSVCRISGWLGSL